MDDLESYYTTVWRPYIPATPEPPLIDPHNYHWISRKDFDNYIKVETQRYNYFLI